MRFAFRGGWPAGSATEMNTWLRPYLPPDVASACRSLAEYVDFVDEDAFRLPCGAWRARELTEFIEAGFIADRARESRLREIVHAYVELAVQREQKVTDSALPDVLATLRRWLGPRDKKKKKKKIH